MGDSHWPLVGRRAALDLIRAVLEDEVPRSVVIAGTAGLGRTRLLREAMALAGHLGRPVRWAAAMEPAAQVPLGALAQLVPAIDGPSDPLRLLQRAAQAVTGERPDPPAVLCVDDVHLLDPLSVALLHQLAGGGHVSLVLTVRTDRAMPDPTAPLWKDDLATRIELTPLGLTDTGRLLARVLGGDVESRSVQRIWQLTGGYPLVIREVVDEGMHSRALRQDQALWRWSGPLTPSQRLSDIVLRELSALEPEERQVLELLAAAESLDVRQLARLSSPGALRSLERRGLLVDDTPSRMGQLRLAHPVVAAVLRSRMSEGSVQLSRRRLEEDRDDLDDEDPLTRSTRLLDAGLPVTDAALVTTAAARALRARDMQLAERLARAAAAAGGGARAARVLAEALRWQGRFEDSDHVARDALASAADPGERSRLATVRALTLTCALDRPDDAAEVLHTAGMDGPDGRPLTATADAALCLLRGDVQSAVRTATGVLRSLPQGSAVLPLAAAVAALGLAVAGRPEEALALAGAGRAALERDDDDVVESLFADLELAQAEVVALHLAGRVHALERRAAELMRDNLAGPECASDAVASLHRGCAALAAGRPKDAARWLREACAGLDRLDPLGVRHWAGSLLSMARALLGESDAGSGFLVGRERKPQAVALYEPFIGLAQACAAASAGGSADAGGLIREAAALAAGQGQAGVHALVLHRAVKVGMAAEVAAQLDELARELDAPFVGILARHAAAVAAGDGPRLKEVSEDFFRAGAVLLAADAATEAAHAFERAGERRASADCRATAVAHLGACGISVTPELGTMSLPTLTAREVEVASLASRGMSNQAIADRLVLSVRTVEAHLSHVYTKFGIANRADLVTAMAGGRGPNSPRRPPRPDGES